MRKCVFITGANGGLGRAMLIAFSSAGYKVIATDLQPVIANDALARINGLVYVSADLSRLVNDEAYAESVIDRILTGVGPDGMSVIVNNAAVQVLGGVESLGVSDWEKSLALNLIAPFMLVQRCLPKLEAAKGCVINISSIHARLTKPNFVAYATSKAALSGMTRAMAVDLGGRIRVNAIEPAAIATDMLKAGFADKPEAYARLERFHPQGRIGTPEEVAALALSIAQGDLRFLHGACVGLDGGISARLHDPA